MIIVQTTPESSIHLVPTDSVQHGVFIERHLMQDSGTRGHLLKGYLQRVGLYDNLLIEFHSSSPQISFRFLIFDAITGRIVKGATPITNSVSVSGNTVKNAAGTTLPMKTLWANLRLSDLGVGEGMYRVAIEVGDNNFIAFPAAPGGVGVDNNSSPWAETRYLISEPLWVRKNWPDSVLITYRNEINNNGFIWEGIGPTTTGQIRVSGRIVDTGLQLDLESYEEGGRDPLLIDSHASTTYELQTKELPLWMRVKLNAIAGLSDVAYSGRRMVAGGKIEQSEGAYLKGINLPLLTQHQQYEYVSGVTGVVVSNLFPFIVAGMRVNGTASSLPTAVLVSSQASQSGAVDALNARLGSYGLNGRFASNAFGAIAYAPDGIEALKELKGIVLGNFIELTAIGYSGTLTTQATTNGYFVAIQPDKADAPFEISPRNNNVGVTTVSVTSNYTPGGAGIIPNLSSRVFVGSSATTLSVVANKATSLTSGRVGLLSTFSLNSTSLSTFDAQALEGALPTLQSVVFTTPNLTSLTGLNRRWNKLNTLDFRNAKLSSSVVDQVIIDVAAYVNAVGGVALQNGFLKLEGQSPAAPPTNASLAAMNYLDSQGWDVTND